MKDEFIGAADEVTELKKELEILEGEVRLLEKEVKYCVDYEDIRELDEYIATYNCRILTVRSQLNTLTQGAV